jgi:hypothetical protein
VLAVTDSRGRHEVLFTPGSVPAKLQRIVKRIEALPSRAPSDSAAAPPPTGTTSDSVAARPDSTANVVDAFARDDGPRGDAPSASATNLSMSGPAAMDTAAVAAAGDPEAPRAPSTSLVPAVRGLTLVSALHFPDGDRENRVQLTDVTPEGVTYDWYFDQHSSDGKQSGRGHYSQFVSTNDLAGAPRLKSVFLSHDQEETPGYTAMTISRAAFSKVLSLGETPYTVTNIEGGPGALASLLPSRLTYRGKLSLASRAVDSIPVLLDGRRTKLPTLHFHGAYTF